MSPARAMKRAASRPLATVRVAAWTLRNARRMVPGLHHDGIGAVAALVPAPAVAADHRSVVAGVLRLTGATCLVRSAVLQRWDADHERPRPLVIGVSRDGDGFAAHAWLEGERSGAGFIELHRRPPA